MSAGIAGALVGLGVGLGLVTTIRYLPRARRPGLTERVLPYVQDVSRPSSLLIEPNSSNPFSVLEGLAAPWVDRCAGMLEQVSGSSRVLQRRLDSAGSDLSVEQFRAQQLVLAVVGLALGIVLTIVAAARNLGSPAALLVLALLAAVGAVVARDYLLTLRIRRRQARILAEFPTVAELLALSVGAGEGVMAAVHRVARTTGGAMSVEFDRVVADVNAGATVNDALNDMSRRVNLLLVTRFVDAMLVSLNNGTPLAEVLRAQAADARAASRRQMMEDGGRREIAMMVPVVFLVLPITVVFAVFPGLSVLNLGTAP